MADTLKQFALRVFEILYGVYALAVFLVFGLTAFVVVLLPMGVAARRHAAHALARSMFWSAGMPIRVKDAQHLPAGPCVVVANHASYLDGVVLKAALPARFCFVIKKEVTRVPLAGLLLRRIGSEFVDRFNRHAGGMDARRLIKAADSGQALAFFPEGTFLAQPGVGKFHTGAFAIAARAALPVVPIAIRGTRRILPSGRLLPRPGRHRHPRIAAARSEARPRRLRPRSPTRAIKRAPASWPRLGEPDLSENDGVAVLQAQRS